MTRIDCSFSENEGIVVVKIHDYAVPLIHSLPFGLGWHTMRTIHAIFQNDGTWFVARCLDFPVTTQGRTLTAAKKNLREAVELYLETWGKSDKTPSLKEVYLTSLEVGA